MITITWVDLKLLSQINVGEPTTICPSSGPVIDLENDISLSSWDQMCLHWLYFELVVKAEQYQLEKLLIAYYHFKRERFLGSLECALILNPLENFKMWVCHESPVTEQLPWNRMRGESIAQQSWQIKYPQRKRYNQWNYFCICAGFGGGRCVCFVKQMTKGTSAEQKRDFNR